MEKELRCEKCLKLLGKFDEKEELEILKPKGKIKFKKNGINVLECFCGKKTEIKI